MHHGIKASIHKQYEVTTLYVEAVEADNFFYWVARSEIPVNKLNEYFPNLTKIIIEDDYLDKNQIEVIPIKLGAITVEWAYCGVIDGRHGR